MKTLILYVLVGGACLVASRAVAAEPSPYTPLAFLVDHTWLGHLPDGPQGPGPAIKLKANWAANHQGIDFDSTFMMPGGQLIPYTSGLYAWDPAKKQLLFLYTDAEGSLTQGTVRAEKETLIHDFAVAEKDGTTSKVQARITPQGANAYLNEIYRWQDGTWKKFVTVRYERQPDGSK